ncbi:response regulator [Ensifer sp. YR511]|uniref:response regulator n=1 Tax=Ensifer sp. YR511 TaxID=1855294 RepID=UPI00088FCB45|nr:response regulator [Ensifer sp. YR511]SDN97322.1 DNA-binding response regulator, OmpR family, contains REC and winged-helix (wHTH) domain [Ensifer sp. YR511]
MSTVQAAATVMIVDDDPTLGVMISEYLEGQGMKALSVASGREMLRAMETHTLDLVLLDLRLKNEDGLDVLRELRQRSDVPVIIATGHRKDEVDRIVGLELGADDYVTKPFSLRELLARIKAVLRRHASDYSRRKNSGITYQFGGWKLRSRTRELFDPSGEAVPLTKGEHALLIAFLDAPQRTLAREHLLQATRVHEDIFDRSIDVQILRLRRKLEADLSVPSMIVTERGLGYAFTLPVERY